MRSVPDANEVVALFAELFAEPENTRLVRGKSEPVYLPAGHDAPYAQVVFAHGFFASALHEVAHWCVAGKERRQLPDFGYWYKPDGRSASEQRLFEQVEVKPQALEWIFSTASGTKFNYSADNLAPGATADAAAWQAFQDKVAALAKRYVVDGTIPPRARRFATALASYYKTGDAWLKPESYCR